MIQYLVSIDLGGFGIVEVVVEDEQLLPLPKEFVHSQSNSSSFNAVTQTKYASPKDYKVKLGVYNVLG